MYFLPGFVMSLWLGTPITAQKGTAIGSSGNILAQVLNLPTYLRGIFEYRIQWLYSEYRSTGLVVTQASATLLKIETGGSHIAGAGSLGNGGRAKVASWLP